jgi:hypothetical protein
MRTLMTSLLLTIGGTLCVCAADWSIELREDGFHLPNGSIEFRVPGSEWRPQLYVAKQQRGSLAFADTRVTGGFTIQSVQAELLQPAAEKQVLRELVRDEEITDRKGNKKTQRTAPVVTIEVIGLEAAQTEAPKSGKARKKTKAGYYEGQARLVVTIGDRTFKLTQPATVTLSAAPPTTRIHKKTKKEQTVKRANITCTANCKASDLGLTEEPNRTVEIRVYNAAFDIK